VNADTAVLRQSSRTAFFKGKVRAWQEKNTLLADELLVQGAGDLIQAKSGVKAVLYNARPEETTTPVIASMDLLTAKKQERNAELTGQVRIEEATRTLLSDRALLFFTPDREIERVEAYDNVSVEEKATGRKGQGEKATYQMASRMLLLDGTPAELTDPRGTIKGEQIVFDIARNQVNIRSSTTASESTYNPQ
jgi:lipopolysaccharide transport protein LptA